MLKTTPLQSVSHNGMKTIYNKMIGFLSLVFLLLVSTSSYSAVITANTGTGDWTAGTTWVGGTAPSTTSPYDDVIIPSGATVNINSTNCRSVDVTVQSGGTLLYTLNDGRIRIYGGGDVTIDAGGIIDKNGTTDSKIRFVSNNNHTLTNNGTLILHKITASCDGYNMILDGSSAISADGIRYMSDNVTFVNNNTSIINITKDIDYDGFSNCVFKNDGSVILTRDMIGSGGASAPKFRNRASANLTIGGSIDGGINFYATYSNNTVVYNSSTVQNLTVPIDNYYNLTVSATDTLNVTANFTVSKNLLITSGIFDLKTFTLTGSGVTDVLTMTGGTLLIGGANNFPTSFNTVNLTGGSVDYNGGNQTVVEVIYNNLVLSGTGTKTMGADITCLNLTVETGVTFIDVPPGKEITCTGNIDIDGTLSVNGDIILSGVGTTIDGTGTVTSTTKYDFINAKTVLASANITFSGSATHIEVKDPLTNNGTFTTPLWLKGSGIWTQGPNAVLNYTNTTDIEPTLNASASENKVNYGATGNQNVKIPADGSYFHLTSSGTGSKYLQTNTDINGDLSILDVAQFDPSDFDITVAGNWINTSTHADAFIQGNELVTFDGSAAQSITCSSGEEIYYDVIINNTGNTISQMDNVKINNQLDWTTSGYLDVNGNVLTIENWNDGDIPTLGTDRYVLIDSAGTFTINGVNAGETANFPMGFSTSSTDFCRLDVENNDGGNTSFSVSPFNYVNYEGTSSGGNQITSYAVDITWNITSTSTDADLTFYWDTSKELLAFNPSSCVVAHKASGMLWLDDISPWTSASNLSGNIYYRAENADDFGPFGIFSGGIALPIKLVSFEANINEDKVDIKWVTSAEINNELFTIERSVDAKKWDEIMVIDGAGNSNQTLAYFEIDYEPLTGISYYRLRQTDFNGEFSYSNIVPVKYEVSAGGLINLFPNPLKPGETLNVEFINIFNSELLVVLRDVKGREFYSKMIINIVDGKLIGIPIDMKIPSGVYLVTATSENQVYSQKLIIKSSSEN